LKLSLQTILFLVLLLLIALPVGLLGTWVQKTALDWDLEMVREKHLLAHRW
jgi:hypothetical protein